MILRCDILPRVAPKIQATARGDRSGIADAKIALEVSHSAGIQKTAETGAHLEACEIAFAQTADLHQINYC